MYKIKLSPYHKIFYNEWKMNPKNSKYNIVFDQLISNRLDITTLRTSLHRLIEDHIILNSHIQETDGDPYWIKNGSVLMLEYIKKDHNSQQIEEYVTRPFNLNNSQLYRFAIFAQTNGYRLIMVMHHVIIDGNSFDELIDKVSKYYNDSLYTIEIDKSSQIALINLTTDQVYKQLEQHNAKNKQFWYEILSEVESIDLRFIKPCNSLQSSNRSHIRNIRFGFQKQVIERLGKLKDKFNFSFYNYGQAIFAILLYKYTYQEKFGITYPIAMQNTGLIHGSGVNTNVFPYSIDKTTTFLDLIQSARQFIFDIKSNDNHRYLPINDILNGQDKNLLDVHFGQVSLKDTKFNFKNVEVLAINDEFYVYLGGKLAFEQEYKDQLLNYRVRYDESKIDKIILEQFIAHYKKLFVEVLEDLENGIYNRLIHEYPILDIQIYNQIFYSDNLANIIGYTNKTIHQCFEEAVVKNPHSIAIKFGNTELTYEQLNHQTNQLSNYFLENYKIKPDNLIALCLDRSPYMIISILAVLKAGAAYVPIDPNYPNDRIKYILIDTKIKLLITDEIYQALMSSALKNCQQLTCEFSYLNDSKHIIDDYDIQMVVIDNKTTQQHLKVQKFTNPKSQATSNNLAYVIYTSGTTGKPQGVLQQHNNVVHLFNATHNLYNFNNFDVWTLFHSYAFDFSVWEIFGALLYGGKLVIPDNEQIQNLESFFSLCKKEYVTVLNQTPSMFYQFSEIVIRQLMYNPLTKLRYIIFGGETLHLDRLKPWFLYYGDKTTLINMYGITEITVHGTYKIIAANELNQNSLIGRVIPGKFAYVLDRNLNLLPIGAIGELYMGGCGLSRGYLNQPKLTDERFITNIFKNDIKHLQNKNSISNSILYKTGDLVRMLHNGDLEYIGRNDSQVKIMGYRIELNEIESAMRNYGGIKQAVVIVKERKDKRWDLTYKYLIGYYVSDYKLDAGLIRNYLAVEIPKYMTPNVLIHIDKLPLTINGKLDKYALPEPELIDNNYVPPSNQKEKIICEVFANVLGVDKIGVKDDFFIIGGNSILAIYLVTKLQHYFKVNVNSIFKLRTPGKIAESVSYIKDNLLNRLKHIKQNITKFEQYEVTIDVDAKRIEYLNQLQHIKFNSCLKNISWVLLTGATGHLGCNILQQLLYTTNYKIYLLIRADSNDDAYYRIDEKFKYYFDMGLHVYSDRVVILPSNLDMPHLNLDYKKYKELALRVDSIIHCAALVKHYSDYNTFYQANVQTTINLLELAKLTRNKDFHYISTIGVFMDGYVPNRNYYIFDENDNNEILKDKNNIYSQTKYEGELVAIKYRAFGVNSNIYRVGNLAMHSKNYKNQKNIEENAFFIKIKTMLNLKLIPKELINAEISPVDYAALAITKLFNQVELSNQTYHLFNQHPSNLLDLFIECRVLDIKTTTLNKFIDTILLKLGNSIEQIELVMLYQSWLQDFDKDHITKISILQDKTNFILSQLGFYWPHITSEMFSDMIIQSFKREIK